MEGKGKTRVQQKPQAERKVIQTKVRMAQGRDKDSPALEAEGVSGGSGGTKMS